MKFIIPFITICFISITSFSQQIKPEDILLLKNKEDSMKSLCLKIIEGKNSAERFTADSTFTKIFVRALKINHSIYYPFDSLMSISRLYAPDSSFRIYTWQMVINENVVRQHGAIQMRTSDGSLRLFPLIDKSDVTENYQDTIGNNFGWMGAVYYKLLMNRHNDKNYYTLIGYDENNIRSNKKIIEIMHFENNEPVFGGNFFKGPDISKTAARFVLEFKKDAGPRLNYDEHLNMIITEHLVSESNEPNKKWTLVGDGDYDGFRWTDGKWLWMQKIFKDVTPEGAFPMPTPLRDDNGNIDKSKLKNGKP